MTETIVNLGLKRLALLPSRQTMHLMAKAAVAAYEAAVERHEEAFQWNAAFLKSQSGDPNGFSATVLVLRSRREAWSHGPAHR